MQLTNNPCCRASPNICCVTNWHEHVAVDVRRKSPHVGMRALLNLAPKQPGSIGNNGNNAIPIHEITSCFQWHAHVMPTYCLHNVYILPAHCLHTACTLPTYCLYIAYILPAHCLHTGLTTLAPCLSNSLTTAVWPAAAARWIGLLPSSPTASYVTHRQKIGLALDWSVEGGVLHAHCMQVVQSLLHDG